MSITADRNGTKAPHPDDPDAPSPVDVEAVLQRLNGIAGDTQQAVVQIEQRRQQLAVQHEKELAALRERQKSQREKLAADSRRLRGVLHQLGYDAPPATKLGPGGRPGRPPGRKKAHEVVGAPKSPKPASMRVVIRAILKLTEAGESVTGTQVLREVAGKIRNDRNNVYYGLNHLRDEGYLRPDGKATGVGGATLWAVWDRDKLTEYMESLDA